VAVLASRAVAGIDPGDACRAADLLPALREAGAGDLVNVLADRAVACLALDSADGVAWLLPALRQAGADDQAIQGEKGILFGVAGGRWPGPAAPSGALGIPYHFCAAYRAGKWPAQAQTQEKPLTCHDDHKTGKIRQRKGHRVPFYADAVKNNLHPARPRAPATHGREYSALWSTLGLCSR
jgi:hypothetical protein